MKYLIISIGAAGFILPSAACAQDVSLFVPTSAVVSYDPFSGLAGLEEMALEMTFQGQTAKPARLVITPDQSSSFLFESLDVPLYFEIESTFGDSGPNSFNAPINLEPTDTPQPLSLTFKIPSGQYADAGDMDIDLNMVVVDSVTNERLSDEKLITLVARTPLRAQTNFAGTSSGFDNGSTFALVDFGELKSGDSRNINFQIRGNSDVDISMSSENNGKLINLDSPASSPINYMINADGLPSDLSEPLVFTRRPAKSLAGTSYPLSITLDNMEQGVFAGSYRDIITVDVTPR